MKNKKNTRKAWSRSHWALPAALVAVVLVAAPTAWSQGRSDCTFVDAPWPIVLPDGSNHRAGSMMLCFQQMWTPASGLHEIRVNGRSAGLFMSRVGTSDESVERIPIVVFGRYDGMDEHRLLGYALPADGAMRTYILSDFGKSRGRYPQLAHLPLVESDTTEILVVAAPSKN